MRALCLAAVAAVIVSFCSAAPAAELITNGSFQSGLAHWNVPANLGPWNPLDEGEGNPRVNLAPADYTYVGQLLFQNLNVSGIGGQLATVSLRLSQNYSSSDEHTVAVYLRYYDNANVEHRVQVCNPRNGDIEENTLVEAPYALPSSARKLVALEISKEAYGEFYADDISLQMTGVTAGAVPVISGIDPQEGPFGTVVTINGSGFGASQGAGSFVRIGGQQAGLAVQSWSASQVRVQVSEPNDGGAVEVLNDFSGSDFGPSFKVTSPYFTLKVIYPEVSVVRNQKAEFLLAIGFMNGFTTTGISLSAAGTAGFAQFLPASLANPGGAVFRVNTGGLLPGDYNWSIRAQDAGGAVRETPVKLKVLQTGDIVFEDYSSWPSTVLTSYTATAQKKLQIQWLATSTLGSEISGDAVTLSSSNDSVLRVIQGRYGPEITAVNDGVANLVATAADGYTENLPVTVDVPDYPRILEIGMLPAQVPNDGTVPISFWATSNARIMSLGWDIPTENHQGSWTWDGTGYSATSDIEAGCDPGVYTFHTYDQYSTNPYVVAPLTIVNSPSKGAISGKMYTMSPTGYPEHNATVKLYDMGGSLVVEKQIWGFSGGGSFTLWYLDPGTYKLYMVPMEKAPQWYLNGSTFEEATPVVVTAGTVTSDINFFLSPKPLLVTSTRPASGGMAGLSGKIEIGFNQYLNSSSVGSGSVTLMKNHVEPVAGSAGAEGESIIFESADPLDPSALYTCTVSKSVLAESGMSLTEAYVFSFMTGSGKLGELKNVPIGTAVGIDWQYLFATGDGWGYVLDPNRASGIRVESFDIPYSVSIDDLVTVYGIMRITDEGERYIEADFIESNGSDSFEPVYVNGRNIHYSSSTGLFVKVAGHVTEVTSDGYLVNDGGPTDVEIRTPLRPLPSVGDWVQINGAAGWEGHRVVYERVKYDAS